ncbi:MAG TPA: type II CAAX endopeptidase family protein [Gammaproteobacteria bacterium]|nr:type II CAAX endopeptidase family protein [Gammaproteobacteria bacterium]
MTKRQAAVDIVFAIVLVPVSSLIAGVLTALFTSKPTLAPTVLIQALLSLAGVNAVLAWRGQTFREIGFRRPRVEDIGRGLVVLFAGFAVNAALTLTVYNLRPAALRSHLSELQSVAGSLTEGVPLAAVLALLLLVGIYEEIVARGLLLTRSRQLFGGTWAPVLFSSALFGLGHFYQGVFGVVQTAIFGAVLATLVLRWGTLWPAIIAHSAVNMLSVVELDKLNLPT